MKKQTKTKPMQGFQRFLLHHLPPKYSEILLHPTTNGRVSTRILSSSEFTHTQPTSIHRTKVTREAAGKKNGIFLCTWKMLRNAHWAQCFPKHIRSHIFRRPHALAPAPPCTSGGRGWPSPYCPTGRPRTQLQASGSSQGAWTSECKLHCFCLYWSIFLSCNLFSRVISF